MVRSSWIRNCPSETASKTHALPGWLVAGLACLVAVDIDMPPVCGRNASAPPEASPGYRRPMYGDADISIPAALLSDPARARVLLALADGRALPASMLASEAGVAASTASEHLAKLCAAGMLSVEPHGRHRYYRIADPRVINAVEALAEN